MSQDPNKPPIRPLDYQTPETETRSNRVGPGRAIFTALMVILGTCVLGFFVLLGACTLCRR